MNHIKPIMDALTIHATHYKKEGDYSATEIISPPRMVTLINRYRNKIETPPEGKVASFIGTGVHQYVEECLTKYALLTETEYELEQRVSLKYKERIINGTFDILLGTHIFDIKTCKTWKTIYDPDMVEWTEQQNIYAYLCRKNGIEVDKIHVIAIYLDWVEGKVVQSKSYPREQIMLYELPMWDDARCEQYLDERVGKLIELEEMDDGLLPECTEDECWQRNKTYAIFKTPDSKRASRVLDDPESIREWCRNNPNKWTDLSQVEVRYPKRTRCLKYCDAHSVCGQYKSYKLTCKDDGTLTKRVGLARLL